MSRSRDRGQRRRDRSALRASRESLNVRGAFLHVATDMVAFVGTAIAGALILVTGWDRFDPLASLGVAALMLWASWGLLRESALIFLERSPTAIDPEVVGRALVAEHDVVQVHDLHVWTVTSGFPALAAHVLVAPESDCHAVRRNLERMLREQFGLDHTTLQVEHAEPRLLTIERVKVATWPLSSSAGRERSSPARRAASARRP